jgi:DNA-binding NarL/FixJ family response regulator
MKQEPVETLMDAIRTVLSGKIFLSPKMSANALRFFSSRAEPDRHSMVAALTDREFEVFQCLGEGLTTQQIAARLRLSPKTVESHRLHLREKLKLGSAMELVKHAVRWAGAQELL